MHITNRYLLAVAAAVFGGALAASTAWGEDIWVKSQSAEIRAGKGAVFPLIATAQKGAKLTVISREPKGWVKVKVNDKEGYVYENSISTDKVEGGGNLLAAVGAGPDASNMSTGAAIRGVRQDIDPEAQQYAKSKNLDRMPLKWLIAFRDKIDPSEWQAFTAAGKVGSDAQ